MHPPCLPVGWLGATTWRGERLLRISVSNWSTTEADIDASIEGIATARRAVLADEPEPARPS